MIASNPVTENGTPHESHMQMLPPELLITIFSYAYLATQTTRARFFFSMNLAQVSKAWRFAALQNSLLWTSVVLDEQHHNCILLVKTFLKRAGVTQPLDLLMCLPTAAPKSGGFNQLYRYEDHNLKNALKVLCAVAARWRTLTLVCGSVQTQFQEILSQTEGKLERLECIHIAGVREKQTQLQWPLFGGNMPSLPALRTLRLSSVRLKGFSLHLPFPPALAGLQCLEFSPGATSSPFSAPRIRDIAGGCTQLTRLLLGGVVPKIWLTPAPQNISLTLPNLKYLQMSFPVAQAAVILDEIVAPELDTLELAPLKAAGWQGFLEHLTRSGRKYQRLNTLHLRDMAPKDTITPELLEYATLSQTDPLCSSGFLDQLPVVQEWPELYAAMPALISLYLRDVLAARIILGLLSSTRVFARGNGEECWPELRTLGLGGLDWVQSRATQSLIIPLVKTRIETGPPLHTIWMDDTWAKTLTPGVAEWLQGRVKLQTYNNIITMSQFDEDGY
jgi:hypothetical protein